MGAENLTPATELYRSLISIINTTGCKEKLLNVKISEVHLGRDFTNLT
jgi:hypothetical protein